MEEPGFRLVRESGQEVVAGEGTEAFYRDGYQRLGRCFDEAYVRALRARADELMLGQVAYDGMFFQHDSASRQYEDLTYGAGYVGPSLRYRKLEKLELDPLFRAHIEHDEIARMVGRMIAGPIAIYRATLFNKAAGGGMALPWHQDGGRFWGVTPAPFLQVWTALDDCGPEAGCLRVIPGSHKDGLASVEGGVIPAEILQPHMHRAVALPAVAGEVILVHNHLWHSAPVNRCGQARRTVSVCYMTAETRCLRKRRAPRSFLRVF
jgi:phytanoyl-CoA hydroxylase